ncbi:MAG: glycosyltransferase family 4 protein [Streptosporangiaceae bacterium]
MRIALVGPAHPYKGGGARHTTELAHRLTAAGHDVIIESWRAQYPARLYPGQQTLDTPEGDPYPRTYRRLAWYRPDGWLSAGRRLRSADLVVFALLTPIQAPAYLAILAALRTTLRTALRTTLRTTLRHRARTAVICHNVLPHERRPGDVPLTRALLSAADLAVVHSAAQAAQARTLAPRTQIAVAQMPAHLPAVATAPADVREIHCPERAVVPPPGQPQSSVADPEPGATTCRLLFFGIVRPYKGLDVLLQALAQVPAHVTLTVAGEFWGGTDDTEKLIADLGLTDRVTLRPGYVPASDIPALFGAADALVLPYREATASQNALLAFAHGIPVITTTAGTLADHVRHNVDGLTCAPGDPDALARALTAVSDPQTARRLRAAVTPIDPDPAWSAYLDALLAS